MHSQYWLLALLEVFVFIGFAILAFTKSSELSRAFILLATGLNCVLVLPRTLLQFILQGTGRIREYGRNFIIERLICIFLIVVFLIVGLRQFEYMIIADIGAKLVAMIELAWICRDIIAAKGVPIKIALKEFWENIAAGINVVLANIASFLIIGIVRFGIEKGWDVVTFGKVSFTLSISNFIIVFIYAVGIVIFPTIKRSNQEKLPIVYETLGSLLSEVMIIFLVVYFPIQKILLLWLPDYYEAIQYFAILFPISIFEARSSLLINTFLKALREEKAMLVLNCISVIISIITTVIIVFLLKNLTLAVFSIAALVIIKCYLPDIYLQKKMNMHLPIDMIWNIAATSTFIICSWYVGGVKGWLVYIVFLLAQFAIRRNKFSQQIKSMKELLGAM